MLLSMQEMDINLAVFPPTGDGGKVLPCPAGGPPRLTHISMFAGVQQEPPGFAQPLSRQRRAQPGGSSWPGGAQAPHTARRKRLGEVRTNGDPTMEEKKTFKVIRHLCYI